MNEPVKLTARQQDILTLIETTMADTGAPPTRAEIATAFGFKSANAAEEHLRALARKGVIELVGNTSRGIRLRTGGTRALRQMPLALPELQQLTLPLIGRVAAGAPIGSAGPLGRLLVRGEQGHDFVPELRPLSSEHVIDKPGYGAFHKTTLGPLLGAFGIRRLLLCGVTTEVCVHSTLREAVDRGFVCTTVGDATAASQAELQAPALAMIGVEGGIFGSVLDTDACVRALQAQPVKATA